MKNSWKSLAKIAAIVFTCDEKNQRLLLEAKSSQTRDFCSVDFSSKQLVCIAQIKGCEYVGSVHIVLMLETSESNNSKSKQEVRKVI